MTKRKFIEISFPDDDGAPPATSRRTTSESTAGIRSAYRALAAVVRTPAVRPASSIVSQARLGISPCALATANGLMPSKLLRVICFIGVFAPLSPHPL
jgi:hypothetical protein